MVFYRWIMEKGETYSGQSWYSNLECFDGFMEERNMRASLSPLYSEIETLIWTMKCLRNLCQFHITFAIYCSLLVKMILEPEKWSAFATYLEDIQQRKSFNYSELLREP